MKKRGNTRACSIIAMSHRDPDLDLLRAFACVAEAGGFTRAGERLGRTQAAISQQVRRLEQALGASLFDRTPHRVRLTPEGETALATARKILDLHDELRRRLRDGEIAGSVRIGAPEDFATRHLPDVLARFSRAYPNVALEVTCDLTLNLLDRFHGGDFDLVLVKRTPGAPLGGVRVWRQPLVWAVGETEEAIDLDPLPLALRPQPCVLRRRATEALARTGRAYRFSYVCESLAGLQAAVAAGLGVTVLSREAVGPGLRCVDAPDRLPPLEDVEITLLAAQPLSEPARRLADHIVRSLERSR